MPLGTGQGLGVSWGLFQVVGNVRGRHRVTL